MASYTRVSLFGAIALAAVVLGDGDVHPAQATHVPYHYATQYTAYNSNVYHHPNCCLIDAYYGWIGVNGQITTPDHFPQMNSPIWDHANGRVGVYTSECEDDPSEGFWCSFMQIGWFAGTIGDVLFPSGSCVECVRRTSSYGSYVERLDVTADPNTYDIWESQTPSFGEAIIYRIERSGLSGCWNVYIRYNQPVTNFCGLTSSGAMIVGGEAYDFPGWPPNNPVELPLSNYGWSNPNTNNALRIKGANGYEPWDTSLIAWATVRYDERCTVPPYQISHYNLWYYFLAKSLSSPISC